MWLDRFAGAGYRPRCRTLARSFCPKEVTWPFSSQDRHQRGLYISVKVTSWTCRRKLFNDGKPSYQMCVNFNKTVATCNRPKQWDSVRVQTCHSHAKASSRQELAKAQVQSVATAQCDAQCFNIIIIKPILDLALGFAPSTLQRFIHEKYVQLHIVLCNKMRSFIKTVPHM